METTWNQLEKALLGKWDTMVRSVLRQRTVKRLFTDRVAPNHLTLVRVIAPLPIIAFLSSKGWQWHICGVAIYIIANLTDLFDGALARERNMVTEVGALLDPFADKILEMSALVALTFLLERTPLQLFRWLIIPEIVLGLIALFKPYVEQISRVKWKHGANVCGKIKTAVRAFPIAMLMLPVPLFWGFATSVLWWSGWLAIASIIVHIVRFERK